MQENNSSPLTISYEALFILNELRKNGHEGYIVGGAVRDMLRNSASAEKNLTAADYDFTTSATPEQVQELFEESFYENDFGTVGIARKHLLEQMGFAKQETASDAASSIKKKEVINITEATKLHPSLSLNTENNHKQNNIEEVYEVTTFRSDGEYKNFRQPESVTWGKTLESDLDRRDFTINAIALSISEKFLEKFDFSQYKKEVSLTLNDFDLIDFHLGIADLDSGIIRTVGNPNRRFTEDALRLLRAIRFSVQLNMQIDTETYEAIIRNSHLIQNISWERISEEFLKIIASDYPKEGIEILDETGILKHIIPELLEGKGIMQAGHHTTDVWTHNLDALAECPSSDPIVRLATLLHDVAKPHTLKIDAGKPTFYNHEVVGSRIARDIAKRLRLSKKNIERIFILVRFHMFHYQPENSDASIRRFMRKVGLENLNDILDLREADRLGSGARKTSWRLEEMKERMREQLHQPFSITDLALNGNDLMHELNMKPGPEIGKILTALFELVLEKPELNTKEALLVEAKKIN